MLIKRTANRITGLRISAWLAPRENVLAGPKGLPESRTVRDAIKLGLLSSREPIDITQLVECDSKMSPREEEGDVSVGGIKDPSGTGPRSW